MPLISIESNQSIGKKQSLSDISQSVATLLGKPESYVMVKYSHNENMLFAGRDDPLAYVEFKSLGLPEIETAEFSEAVCNTVGEILQIQAERIYIEFSSPDRHMWGWNKTTF